MVFAMIVCIRVVTVRERVERYIRAATVRERVESEEQTAC